MVINLKKRKIIANVIKLFKIIGDSVFCFFAALALFIITGAYFFKGKTLIAVSIVLALAVGIFSFFRLKNKNAVFIKKSDNALKEAALKEFFRLSDRFLIFRELEKAAKRKNIGVTYKKKNLYLDGKRVFLIFNYSGVDLDDLLKIAKTARKFSPVNSKDIIDSGNYESSLLFCDKLTEGAKTFVEKLSFLTVYDMEQTFSFFDSSGYFPDITYKKEKKKFSFKEFLKKFLKRKNSSKFLLAGITLAFLSFFTPLKAYYVTFSLFLIISAAFSRFYGETDI